MSTIRWLHISDLHFNDEDMSTILLRDELPKFLTKNSIRCDYVFCTGDIRVGSKVFPDDAAEYLKKLCSAVGIDTSRLFIVPGNHDVNRTSAGRDDAVEQIMFQRKGYYNPAIGKIEEKDLMTIHTGQKEFRNFLTQLYDKNRMNYYENALKPHFSIETDDFNVIHIDTTLSYRENQEATDLIIGTMPLLTTLRQINQEKPSIVLSHYPITCLLQDERKVVSELLYKYGVRLWLAGHEHDHNLMPVKYLYSVQAGELRREDKTHATVLVGSCNMNTLRGYISAYSWFTEGWATYPIIWHENIWQQNTQYDKTDEDKFPFVLKRLADDGKSPQEVLIKQANQTYISRLPKKIWNSIFPDLDVSGTRHKEGLLALIHSAWNSEHPHLILLADGGMGKSTILLDICNKSSNMLYIPLEGILTINYGIEQYCTQMLFNGSQQSFHDYVRVRYSAPDLILLIDGLNEVDAEAERRFINEIKQLNMLKGIQIVIASRSDFTPKFSMSGYQMISLLPLTDEQIQQFFSESYEMTDPDRRNRVDWMTVEGHPTLRHLLSNPMMLTMYMEVCPVIEQYKECEFLRWHVPIENATDLLFNYYLAQIAVLILREGTTGDKALKSVQCVYDVLPYVAYIYESTYRLNAANQNFRDLIKAAVSRETMNGEMLDLVAEYFRCSAQKVSWLDAIDILTNDLHLVYKGNQYTAFPHQIHRDYLSAFAIVQETKKTGSDENDRINAMWNKRNIPRSVMTHIAHLSGKYWSGIAEIVHATGAKRDDAINLTSNLLDCFPYTKDSGIPDYSGLNLCHLPLPDYPSASGNMIPLKNSRLDAASIGRLDIQPTQFQQLCFSADNHYLAAAAGNKIVIFPLGIHEETFRYNLNAAPGRLAFAGNYLFAVIKTEKIVVFHHDDIWMFTGEIASADTRNLLGTNLKKIILKDDILYFYFNNKEQQYQLPDGKRIKNSFSEHAWKHAPEGYDLSLLLSKKTKTQKKAADEICTIQHNGLTASAKIDGSLTVSGGTEIYYILNRGVTRLKDGSISGDGKWAATLSHEQFGGQRKIQLWNLDDKHKVAELYCSKTIERLHLSQYGTWMIGETDQQSWVYNCKSGTEEWFEEHFISNQESKLITYGDNILRKNKENLVYEYNLWTKGTKMMDNLANNAKFAVYMPDHSLALTGNNAATVLFRNSRNGIPMKVNRQPARVSGIYPFKKQPFIAVATQDNVISIYHTGTGQRLRILETKAGNRMISVHPEEGVIACTNGRQFETYNFYEKQYSDKKRGWWYQNKYNGSHHINSSILDLAFNSANQELVVILSNGEIIFCHDKYCGYHDKLEIIINFNLDAYDFRGCLCSDEIKEQLRQNGALV